MPTLSKVLDLPVLHKTFGLRKLLAGNLIIYGKRDNSPTFPRDIRAFARREDLRLLSEELDPIRKCRLWEVLRYRKTDLENGKLKGVTLTRQAGNAFALAVRNLSRTRFCPVRLGMTFSEDEVHELTAFVDGLPVAPVSPPNNRKILRYDDIVDDLQLEEALLRFIVHLGVERNLYRDTLLDEAVRVNSFQVSRVERALRTLDLQICDAFVWELIPYSAEQLLDYFRGRGRSFNKFGEKTVARIDAALRSLHERLSLGVTLDDDALEYITKRSREIDRLWF